MRRTLIFLACAVALAVSGQALSTNDTVKVDGGLISGTAADGIRSFKGIPFAAPPVGELRWKASQPVVPWQGVRQCDTFGPECPQSPYPAGSMYALSVAAQDKKVKSGLTKEDWAYKLADGVTTKEVTYYSDGVACYAKLFFPKGFSATGKTPGVVLGQGWTGTHP